MYPPRVTVVIPTLAADHALWECVESLQRQTYPELQIVIVDNSGSRRSEADWPPGLSRSGVEVLHPGRNLGYGAAINLGARRFPADYIAVLNDDAAAEPEWAAELVKTMEAHPEAGLAASQVRLHGEPDRLDSAGMLIAADGSSKQRGQGDSPSRFGEAGEVLLASGSASIYRSKMLEETGGFDDSYFLYCEDTDLGLRALWAGWTCRYVPTAVAGHRYSHSAGRASKLKAYFVERNRLLTIVKNFPLRELLLAPWLAPLRYAHHYMAMRQGRGAASEFRKSGGSVWTLAGCILRAHAAVAIRLPGLLRERRKVRSRARIGVAEFRAALRAHRISLKQVAAL